MKEIVVVTGGAGFIGSHVVVELLENGYEVVVVDNLSNASPEVFHRIEQITNKKLHGFHNVDIVLEEELDKVFALYTDPKLAAEQKVAGVIHLAGEMTMNLI